MSTLSEDVLPTGTFVDAGDVRMHLHDLGAGGAGTVLFLHGSGPGASGWSNFHPSATALVEQGYRCLLLDSLGYGRSDKPTDRDYTLEVMAGAALGVLDALDLDRVHLVGNSQGGAQAIWLAVHHPDRVGKLVLMAPGGLEDRETYMQMRGIRSMAKCIYGPEGITAAGMHKVFEKQVYDPAIVPRDVIDKRVDVALTQPRHVFERMRVGDQRPDLGNVRAPTLCLWGMDDLFCPVSGAHTIAENVPDARVVLLTKCGHWVMVEHRSVFDRYVLDFLAHG